MADQVGSAASGGSSAVAVVAHMNSTPSSSSSAVVSCTSPAVHVNLELLEPATAIPGGDVRSTHAMASECSRVLLVGVTPLGNTCLHISSVHGHDGFCKNAVKMVGDTPSSSSSSSSSGAGAGAPMDGRLLEAATSGDAERLALVEHGVLLGATPQGNNCLHIASIHGHEELCKILLTLEVSRYLLAAVNGDGETPLLAAVARGRASLASVLLRSCRDQQLGEAILKQDKRGCNVLHHAIRGGHGELALELIEAEPALSRDVNDHEESPMFIAAMRNYADVVEKLLEVPEPAHGGSWGYNALHAAVRNGNAGET